MDAPAGPELTLPLGVVAGVGVCERECGWCVNVCVNVYVGECVCECELVV